MQLVLRSAHRGSFEIQVLIDVLNAVGLDHDNAKNILLNIIAAALWDFDRSKRITKDFRRGMMRVARGARGKTIRLSIRVGRRIRKWTARLSRCGEIEIVSDVNGTEDLTNDDESK